MKNLVWLASYPRSGNTWFRIFLSGLMGDFHSKTDLNRIEIGLMANSRHMFDELSGISASDLTISEIDNLRPTVYKLLSQQTTDHIFLKTHDRYFFNNLGKPVFPTENTFVCVYFIRNPLDVVVSNAYYFGRCIEKEIQLMSSNTYTINSNPNGLLPVLEEKTGSWSEHVMSWYNSGLKVHFVRYEDMANNPVATFATVVQFLGYQYSDDLIAAALSQSAFDKLREIEKKSGFNEKIQGEQKFFRSGKPGSWKTELNDNQINKILTDHETVMKLFRYLDPENKILD